MVDIRDGDNRGHRRWRRVRGVARPGAAVALLLGVSVGVQSSAQPPPSDDSLAPYAALVAELDLRRRVNVLHPNPQSILDGFHVGHVNIGAGNLTFRRRDMVARADGAVVFARVYDSRIQDNADLGPGWRLSLAEELRLDGDRAVYTDRSGAAHAFRLRKDGEYVAAPPTPRHADTTLSVSGDKAVLRERDSAKRVFLRPGADAPFLLRRAVSAAGRELLFAYENGRLRAVTHGGAEVFTIARRRDGKVREVADRHGRSVGYSYSADGRLKDVYDIAGNLWWHEYDADGRLAEAFGANGRPYLRVGYDDAGRVPDTRAGRAYRYAYEGSRTVVTDGDGRRHVFEQNRQGATERYSANTGAWWKIGFGVRITQRPPDAYLGNRDLSASGDFDNDGRLDEAFFLLRTGDNSAMVIALVVSFGSTRTLPGARLRIVDTFVNVSEYDIRDFGLRVARPGQYTAACARGYGDPCRDDEEEELALARDGVYFYDFESSSRLYYLPEGAKDGDFKEFWLSD